MRKGRAPRPRRRPLRSRRDIPRKKGAGGGPIFESLPDVPGNFGAPVGIVKTERTLGALSLPLHVEPTPKRRAAWRHRIIRRKTKRGRVTQLYLRNGRRSRLLKSVREAAWVKFGCVSGVDGSGEYMTFLDSLVDISPKILRARGIRWLLKIKIFGALEEKKSNLAAYAYFNKRFENYAVREGVLQKQEYIEKLLTGAILEKLQSMEYSASAPKLRKKERRKYDRFYVRKICVWGVRV